MERGVALAVGLVCGRSRSCGGRGSDVSMNGLRLRHLEFRCENALAFVVLPRLLCAKTSKF